MKGPCSLEPVLVSGSCPNLHWAGGGLFKGEAFGLLQNFAFALVFLNCDKICKRTGQWH